MERDTPAQVPAGWTWACCAARWNNMISNLRKYADPSAPLKLRWRRDGRFEAGSNRVHPRPGAESTGLGLKTCKRILALHGGSFETREENGWFMVRTCLPCQELK